MTEKQLFQETNDYISQGQSSANSGDVRRALSYYEQAANNLQKLMEIDRAYYQKYLYAIYDEMGILYFMELKDYKKAYEFFDNAYKNCKDCANREPDSIAADDLEYIASRRNIAANA